MQLLFKLISDIYVNHDVIQMSSTVLTKCDLHTRTTRPKLLRNHFHSNFTQTWNSSWNTCNTSSFDFNRKSRM